jgi:hypothetical protein
MGDPFASTKEPSLFPITLPGLKVSKNEYRIFYKGERALLRIFLVLHRDMVESTLVIGFLLWLERERYTSYNLGTMLVNSLTPDVINQVADEAVTCINLMRKKASNLIMDVNRYDKKPICLKELHRNGDSIFHEVSGIADDVSVKAFDDFLEQFISINTWLLLGAVQIGYDLQT